jgi:chaperonin GroEL
MRQNRLVRLDAGAREEILRGASVLSSAVRVTMGPRGRNVIIGRPDGPPILTKDGVTVAKAVNLSDPFQDLGVQAIKEAAARTAEDAGDGTTGATVLAHAILSQGVMLLAAGFSATELKEGIDHGVDRVVASLRSMAVPVSDDQVEQVGTISANGETQIGSMIAQAYSLVGRDGVISVEEARSFTSSLEHVEGAQIDRGYLSPYFITNQEKSIVELEKPLVLLTNRRISTLREILPLLEKVASQKRSLLIIADDVEGDAMQGLVLNHSRGTIQVCAIKAPGFGHGRTDCLTDLSVLLSCSIVDGEGDFSRVTVDALGTCRRATISRSRSILVGCPGDREQIEARASTIRASLARSDIDEGEMAFLRSRLSRLTGGVAIIRVGGSTEMEIGERKDRVDDAVNAVLAALQEGILPGGGVALVRASRCLEDVSGLTPGVAAGVGIVREACKAALRQIADNAGRTPDVVLEKVLETSERIGYDAARNRYGDMVEMGIIDPHKVIRCALENAASAAGMLLTVGCALVDEPTSQSEADSQHS